MTKQAVIALALTLAAAACATDTPQLVAPSTVGGIQSEEAPPEETTTTAAAGFFQLGDTVEDSSIQYTPNAVEIVELDEFDDPAPAGTRRVVVTGTAASVSGQSENISGWLFDGRTSDGVQIEQDIFTSTLSGDLVPSVPLVGTVAYFVPDGVESFLLLVQLDLFGNPAVYEISVPA